jgi:host factor-I protein
LIRQDFYFASENTALLKEIGTMESKPAQNIQDTFLNTVRKDKSPITIYLVSGVKLTGRIRSFDKYSVLLENNSQEQLIFKHAISTVVSGRAGAHTELRSDAKPEVRGAGPSPVTSSVVQDATGTHGT